MKTPPTGLASTIAHKVAGQIGRFMRARRPRTVRRDPAMTEKKASAVGAVIAMQAAGRPVWTPRDYASLTQAGYADNVVAFRAVRMVAEGAAAIPLRLRRDAQVMETHPFQTLLARPNPSQSGQDLLESLYGHLQTAGNAYLELVRSASGAPLELYALRPDRMRVIPGEDGWPDAYEYAIGGRKRRFAVAGGGEGGPALILHLKAFHPLNDHYGMSPLEAAMRSVDVHNAASAWTKALLDNAARPSGAVVYSARDGAAQLSDEQYHRLVDELEAHHQGARNAGRPMLLEGGLDWRPMAFSPADMEFLKTKETAAREIALAFGAPPMLLGLPGDATYANFQEANRAFARHTLLPLVKKTAAAIAAWASPAYDAPFELVPDLDQLPALAAERDARWRRVAAADFLSDDEKRRQLGL